MSDSTGQVRPQSSRKGSKGGSCACGKREHIFPHNWSFAACICHHWARNCKHEVCCVLSTSTSVTIVSGNALTNTIARLYKSRGTSWRSLKRHNTNLSVLGDLESIGSTRFSLQMTTRKILQRKKTVSEVNGLDKRSDDQPKSAPAELKQPETTETTMKRTSLSKHEPLCR